MTINEHKTVYASYPAQVWNKGPLAQPASTAYRIAADYDDPETWTDKFTRFLAADNAAQVEALIVGAWWGKPGALLNRVVEALVQHHSRLPHLAALFIGDVTFEESEISWINQTDVSPLLLAYPRLAHFGTRGSDGLHFGRLQHAHLRSWTIESGGLPRALLQQVITADMPQLENFEVWTGSSEYGWDGTVTDLLPILHGEVFPNLTRLAIRNSEIADDVAQALVESPLYERLEHLDLSMGIFGDAGAKALLGHPATRRLKSLDVRHHFCTPPNEALLYGLLGDGVKVFIDTAQNERDWDDDEDSRYVAVGE